MENRKNALILKAVIIFIAALGVMICALWYPFMVSLTAIGPVNDNVTLSQNIELWTQLIFYWLVSIPCFAMLVFFWKITNLIKTDNVFTIDVSELLKKSSVTLLINLVIFVLGNLIFLILGWNDLALIYFFVAVVGFGFVAVTMVLSHYVKEASYLREENEGTI